MQVVRLSALRTDRLYLQGDNRDTHFCHKPNQSPGPQCDLRDYVNAMTPSGLEHVTFRLAAQCLKQLRHRVPPFGVERVFKMLLR